MPEFKEYFKEIMETAEQIIDNPTGWVGNHIRMYVESNGEKGHDWHGMRTLLLTTRGCKSGKLRRTALIYGEADGNYLIIASNGGADDHPLWYLNLSENDEVEIQVGASKIKAHARTQDPEGNPIQLWQPGGTDASRPAGR